MDSLTWTSASGTAIDLLAAPYRVLQGATGLDALPQALSWEPRVTFDGSTLTQRRAPVRPLLLPIFVISSTPTEDTRALFSAMHDGPGTLTAVTGAVARRLQNVVVEGWSDTRDDSTAGVDYRRVVASLAAGDPYWYGPQSSQFADLGTATTFDDATVSFDDAAMPFDGGDSMVLTVEGDADAFPIFYLTGPFSSLSVSLGGLAWELAGALASGSQLVIDTRPGSRGPRTLTGTTDWSLLTAESRLFELPVGAATLAVSSTGADGVSRCEVRWSPRWLTP